jgi:hypothetical protein
MGEHKGIPSGVDAASNLAAAAALQALIREVTNEPEPLAPDNLLQKLVMILDKIPAHGLVDSGFSGGLDKLGGPEHAAAVRQMFEPLAEALRQDHSQAVCVVQVVINRDQTRKLTVTAIESIGVPWVGKQLYLLGMEIIRGKGGEAK